MIAKLLNFSSCHKRGNLEWNKVTKKSGAMFFTMATTDIKILQLPVSDFSSHRIEHDKSKSDNNYKVWKK